MKPKRVKKNGQMVEITNISEPKEFKGVYKEAALAMNFSYDKAEGQDDQGNPIVVYFWINGDWKLNYKGQEYIIPMEANVNALIELINSQERQ